MYFHVYIISVSLHQNNIEINEVSSLILPVKYPQFPTKLIG